jgi:hypothetical protein
MWLLATYADSDGSRVWPGETTLAASMGLSRRAVTYRLADLKNLGFIENGGYHGERGARIRTIKIDSIQAKASGAQSSADPECNLRDPERNLGDTGTQASARPHDGEQDSEHWMPGMRKRDLLENERTQRCEPRVRRLRSSLQSSAE